MPHANSPKWLHANNARLKTRIRWASAIYMPVKPIVSPPAVPVRSCLCCGRGSCRCCGGWSGRPHCDGGRSDPEAAEPRSHWGSPARPLGHCGLGVSYPPHPTVHSLGGAAAAVPLRLCPSVIVCRYRSAAPHGIVRAPLSRNSNAALATSGREYVGGRTSLSFRPLLRVALA
jgi:hypothetical protein